MNPAVGAARADFMRYALLWVRGGVYLDADCCVRGPLDAWLRGGAGLQLLYEPRQFPYHAPPRTDDPDERDIAARAGRVFAHLRARGVASEPGGAHSLLPLVVAQWFLAARPRHPVLGAALARVARSYDAWADDGDALALEARFKVVYLTGPALFNAVLRDDAGGDVDVLGVVEKPGRPWDAWVAEAYGDRRVAGRAAKESEIPNFKGSYLGRFPLVSADFWTSDHLSERSRSVDAFSGTRARGTLTLKRR